MIAPQRALVINLFFVQYREEVGKVLQRTVSMALSPLKALLFGYEKFEEFICEKVPKKLRDIPLENIVTPKLNVAGPLLEALRYTGHEPLLSDLYANLLAASMNKEIRGGAHPAFVGIIQQMTSDEARLFKFFSDAKSLPLIKIRREYKISVPEKTGGADVLVNFSLFWKKAELECPEQVPVYIENLCRMKLTEIPSSYFLTASGMYEALENDPEVQKIKNQIEEDPEWECVIEKQTLQLTQFGKQFIKICVSPLVN
jgi:hypothetical protein